MSNNSKKPEETQEIINKLLEEIDMFDGKISIIKHLLEAPAEFVPELSERQRQLLVMQFHAACSYVNCLSLRIQDISNEG